MLVSVFDKGILGTPLSQIFFFKESKKMEVFFKVRFLKDLFIFFAGLPKLLKLKACSPDS